MLMKAMLKNTQGKFVMKVDEETKGNQ